MNIATNNKQNQLEVGNVKFTESGILVHHDEKKQKIKFLSYIHILGYRQETKGPITVVCLEYGIIAEGKDKKNSIQNLIMLVKKFLQNNTEDIIDKFLDTDTEYSHFFWALYRKYEKKQLRKLTVDISKTTNQEQTQPQHQNIKLLEKENKRLKNELATRNQVVREILQENVRLSEKLKKLTNFNIPNTDGIIFLDHTVFPYQSNAYA